MESFIDASINITSKGLEADINIDKGIIDSMSALSVIKKEDVTNIVSKNIKCMMTELDELVKNSEKRDPTEIIKKMMDEFFK